MNLVLFKGILSATDPVCYTDSLYCCRVSLHWQQRMSLRETNGSLCWRNPEECKSTYTGEIYPETVIESHSKVTFNSCSCTC